MDSGLCNRCILFNAIASNAPCSGMCPAKKGLDGHIVPHGRIERKTHVYKVGRNNALALSPQLSNQGPLIRGPFTCQPPFTRASAWSCHVSSPPPWVGPRGSATWPCVQCRIRAGPMHHVNSASPVEIQNPLFAFLKELKINENQNKIQKNPENSEIYIFKNITPFFTQIFFIGSQISLSLILCHLKYKLKEGY